LRRTLVSALADCAESSVRSRARRFLTGLSADELQFIADFVGACILESGGPQNAKSQVAVRLAQFQTARLACCRSFPADQDHKMLVLFEYLCRSGIRPAPVSFTARHA
jgi:hypothetical protein